MITYLDHTGFTIATLSYLFTNACLFGNHWSIYYPSPWDDCSSDPCPTPIIACQLFLGLAISLQTLALPGHKILNNHLITLGLWSISSLSLGIALSCYTGWSWASGHLGTWASGHLGFWASGHLGIWASGLLGFWESGNLGFWASGHLAIWASGHPGKK